MRPKPSRPPLLAALLLIAALVLAIRSLRVSDVVRWQSIDEQGPSLVKTSLGVRTSLLGLGIFYDEAIAPIRNAREVDAALATITPGISHATEALPEKPSLPRRLGFGFDRTLDERPESFTNHTELTVPLWLIALLLAIGPARWLVARRRETASARSASSDATDTAHPARRSNMRMAAIALVCGIVIGVVVTLLVARRDASTNGAAVPSATSAPATPADEKPPIHPIVGMWGIRIDPMVAMVATYRFANDGSFVLTFRGPLTRPRPSADGAPAIQQDAGGTWRVDGKTLVLTNTWSNTPLTVVGETETATIVSVKPDSLELDHLDRKGKTERLTFTRAYPFVKGKADVPAVVGQWKTTHYTLGLQSGGDVALVYHNKPADPHKGTWSQSGKTLTLLMDPPYVRSAARRAADPSLTQPREELYDVRSVDDLRMILHPADAPPTNNVVFERLEPGPR